MYIYLFIVTWLLQDQLWDNHEEAAWIIKWSSFIVFPEFELNVTEGHVARFGPKA